MREVVQELRKHYDYVILDSPSVQAAEGAEALAALCDGVLFVVRARQSEKGVVAQAVERLHTAGAKILGFVLNDVDAETAKHSPIFTGGGQNRPFFRYLDEKGEHLRPFYFV